MGLVLDSSPLIAAERGKFDLKNFLKNECASDTLFVTSITASELLHGWERAPAGKKKQIRKQYVEAILSTYSILDFELTAARQHAYLWAHLEKKGHMIGPHDLLIAATCRALDYELATLNEKEFKRVPGLKLRPTGKYVIS